MKKSKEKYKRMNTDKSITKVNYIMVLIIISLFLIGILAIKLGVNVRQEQIPIYKYESQKNVEYKVLLKPNEFYATEILPSGLYYASQSIDDITINFKYNFEESPKAILQYNYNITADLIGTANTNNNQEKEVWKRNFILLEKKEQENTTGMSINEQINIDYQYYNTLARSYERTYGITIDTVLKIRLNILNNVNLSEWNIDNQTIEDYIEIYIPINNTVTEVKEEYEKTTSNKIDSLNMDSKEIIYYIIGALLILLSVILIIIEIIKSKRELTPQDIYENNINHIITYYRDLIVTVINEPNLDNLEIMKVANLDDLIDVAEQNKRSIIHYEEENEQISYLYVFVDKYAYVYVVTQNELR